MHCSCSSTTAPDCLNSQARVLDCASNRDPTRTRVAARNAFPTSHEEPEEERLARGFGTCEAGRPIRPSHDLAAPLPLCRAVACWPMEQQPEESQVGFEMLLEHIASHRRERSALDSSNGSKRIHFAALSLFAITVLAVLATFAAGSIGQARIAQVAASVAAVTLTLVGFLIVLAAFWPMVQEIRTRKTPLVKAHDRAATNFRFVRELVLRFDRRTLETARSALDAERQLLDNRKPLARKIGATVVLLILAVRARQDGFEIPTSLSASVSLLDFLDHLTSEPSGWFTIAAMAAVLWPFALFYDAIAILTAHCSLLDMAIQQRQEDDALRRPHDGATPSQPIRTLSGPAPIAGHSRETA